jgi:hypothetical protein
LLQNGLKGGLAGLIFRRSLGKTKLPFMNFQDRKALLRVTSPNISMISFQKKLTLACAKVKVEKRGSFFNL